MINYYPKLFPLLLIIELEYLLFASTLVMMKRAMMMWDDKRTERSLAKRLGW